MRKLIGLNVLLGSLLLASLIFGDRPEPQLTLPCVITDVYDGDTVTVEVRLPIRVRMLDCWAPELNTAAGKEAKAHLVEISEGRRGVLQLPLKDVQRSDDMFSFGRALGTVWIERDEKSLSQRMVDARHATKRKP